VTITYQRRGELVNREVDVLHAEDFDDELRPFSFDACGFVPTNAGLIDLTLLT